MSNATKVSYLVTEYPSVSHAFIRREILAVERQGIEVQRIAVRGWDNVLVDDEDASERQRTRYLLESGGRALLLATAWTALTKPGRFMSALALASQMGRRRAQRGVLYHWVYLAEACLAARWISTFGAAHVHAHFGTNSAAVAALIASLTQLPYSFTVHGPDEFDNPLGYALEEKTRRAAFVATISSYGRSQMFRWARVEDWPKVQIVRCGIDRKFLSAAITPPPDNQRFVCVARLSAQKGHVLLLHALRRVLDDGHECELVLAGDGEMRRELETLIDRLRLGSHVRITGWITGDQVLEELTAARALVMASFAEGLPVVIMEAMALGRPVLSSSVAGVPELVHDGRTGWLFPAGDQVALAAAIVDCLSKSPGDLAVMGRDAQAAVRRLHDIDNSAADLTRLFRKSWATG